jgi:hypothetical protein
VKYIYSLQVVVAIMKDDIGPMNATNSPKNGIILIQFITASQIKSQSNQSSLYKKSQTSALPLTNA